MHRNKNEFFTGVTKIVMFFLIKNKQQIETLFFVESQRRKHQCRKSDEKRRFSIAQQIERKTIRLSHDDREFKKFFSPTARSKKKERKSPIR